MTESWKDIPGYEELYSVSGSGKVLNKKKSKLLKPGKFGRARYPKVTLSRRGFESYHNIHILVLTAFRGPCPEGQQARHLDDNPDNNCLDNLFWGTQVENRADHVRLKGVYHAAKLTTKEVIEIRHQFDSGQDSMKAIARTRQRGYCTIRDICRRRSWKHLP